MNSDPTDFDLDTLCEQALEWLCRLPTSQDGRVQEVPDPRTVRYYQTIGVVERPLRYEGRSARYGRRHLLQVVAVKVLQAKGFSLAQIQAALLGASDAALEKALGEEAVGKPAPAAVPAVPKASTRITAELAPGVFVMVDPSVVADPQALLQVLGRALLPAGGSK